jgi:UPF0716 protein FxsA
MGILLLAAFIGLPLIEIWVFIEVGGEIGALTTVGICVLTALIGTVMLRAQGLATLKRARGQMEQGVLPARELFDGLCLLIAGAFLLTPGFVTDAMGFLLLIPAFRELLRTFAARHLAAHAKVHVHGGAGRRSGTGEEIIIEGEFEEMPDDENGRHAPPGRHLPPKGGPTR